MNGGWPLLLHVEELFSCAKIGYSFLCNAVLKVGIDATEGEALSLCIVIVLEGIVGKAFIVAVLVEDADAMLLGKVFKQALGFHHFF